MDFPSEAGEREPAESVGGATSRVGHGVGGAPCAPLERGAPARDGLRRGRPGRFILVDLDEFRFPSALHCHVDRVLRGRFGASLRGGFARNAPLLRRPFADLLPSGRAGPAGVTAEIVVEAGWG